MEPVFAQQGEHHSKRRVVRHLCQHEPAARFAADIRNGSHQSLTDIIGLNTRRKRGYMETSASGRPRNCAVQYKPGDGTIAGDHKRTVVGVAALG